MIQQKRDRKDPEQEKVYKRIWFDGGCRRNIVSLEIQEWIRCNASEQLDHELPDNFVTEHQGQDQARQLGAVGDHEEKVDIVQGEGAMLVDFAQEQVPTSLYIF